jgi:hypothetical protein
VVRVNGCGAGEWMWCEEMDVVRVHGCGASRWMWCDEWLWCGWSLTRCCAEREGMWCVDAVKWGCDWCAVNSLELKVHVKK